MKAALTSQRERRSIKNEKEERVLEGSMRRDYTGSGEEHEV